MLGWKIAFCLRLPHQKSSTLTQDGVENFSSVTQKCVFCLRLPTKPDFPPRYRDAYSGVEDLLKVASCNDDHNDHDDRLERAKSQKLSSRPWANWAKHEQGSHWSLGSTL